MRQSIRVGSAPLIALAMLLAITSCEREGTDANPSVADADSLAADSAALCAGVHDGGECHRRIEARRLAGAQGRVQRAGDSLIIAMGDAAPVVLVDSVDADEVGVRYTWHGTHPRLGWHLVHVQEYEGDGWLLVHPRTRAEFPLDARPVYAPGMRRFATASLDLEAGYNANALRILSLDADSVWIEWEVEPDDWGPASPSWTSNNMLHFTRRVLVDGERYVDSAAVVTFTGEGWQLGQP